LIAAQQLRERAGEPFYRAVARALADKAQPGNGDIDKAVRIGMSELHCERKVTL